MSAELMNRDAVDSGRKAGVTIDEQKELPASLYEQHRPHDAQPSLSVDSDP